MSLMKTINLIHLLYGSSNRTSKVIKTSLKSIFIVLLTLTSMSVDAQNLSFIVKNDSIYTGLANRYVGYIRSVNNIKTAVVGNSYIAINLKSRKFSHLYDRVQVEEDIILKFDFGQKKIFDYQGREVGIIQTKETLGRSILPPSIKFTMFYNYYSELEVKSMFRNSSAKMRSSSVSVNYDLSEKIRIDREKRESMKALERQRIERFYAQVYERLSGDLTPIEGVYKSIDLGEKFEYDIAVLQSNDNERELIGVILSSTDVALSVGSRIFTFEKTAQPNLFFAQYKLKSGESKDNKTALLEGGILKMGLKSFIKMYPSEGEKRRYEEVNPVFDWESSGSGVLINQSGYIVTNNHVATGAKKIRIAFQNDSIDYNAVIVSQNEQNDVAILKIVDERFTSDLKPVMWSNEFNLGQKVFTLGYPISNKMSDNVKVVDGIVSGQTGRNGALNYFQTTLPVWYGNSGGPCFNAKGEILGLATQILFDKGAKVDNVAYITKTDNILNLAGDLILDGKASSEEKSLEQLIKELVPYSVFIKVNY